MSSGRVFQRRGAATEKRRAAMSILWAGTNRRSEEPERSVRVWTYGFSKLAKYVG